MMKKGIQSRGTFICASSSASCWPEGKPPTDDARVAFVWHYDGIDPWKDELKILFADGEIRRWMLIKDGNFAAAKVFRSESADR
jgi:hypothetical protein